MNKKLPAKRIFWCIGSSNVRALVTLLAIFSYTEYVHADTCISQTPQPMLYWCLGGICDFTDPYPSACPVNADVATFKSCSEANYNEFLFNYWGSLTFLSEAPLPDSPSIIQLLWSSEKNGNYNSLLAPVSCDQFWVSVPPPPGSECDSCDRNSVGYGSRVADPISPVSGAVSRTDADLGGGAIRFSRFFNSSNFVIGNLGQSWRHSYSRNIKENLNSVSFHAYVSGPDNSSLYSDIATACINGFAQIKPRVTTWTGAVASFINGNCMVSKNGSTLGSLNVYSSSAIPEPYAAPISFDSVRDDGQLIRFIVNNGVITAPPGIGLRLQQISSGFTITDANDNVEQYDTNGKLLTATSRSGVVQTMSYDSAGRLSNVIDSFGHQLIFSYDAQGQMSTVTRQ